jgi:1-aminocyclopropane-1-carboxylate deaminase/D-cysteine desulfhydrase-like pyridoxal-dependent ACC family enzyme
MWPVQSKYLNIDISRIDTLVRAANQRDGGLHVLAGSVSNLSVAESMLEKAQEILQANGEHCMVVNDDFDTKTIANSAPGTLFFFSEIRKQEANGHSVSVVEQCVNSGGTVFAVAHGQSHEGVTERLLSLGMSQALLDTRLKVESFIADMP